MTNTIPGFRRVGSHALPSVLGSDGRVEYAAELTVVESDALHRVFEQLLGLLDRGSTRVDPAMRRLLPDGYRDDEAAADELRRFTQTSLLDGKRQACREVLADLPDGAGRVSLSVDRAHTWLTALTDVRLVLGTRLEITADTDVAASPDRPDDPDEGVTAFLLAMYQHLTFLQESLLRAVAGRPPFYDADDTDGA